MRGPPSHRSDGNQAAIAAEIRRAGWSLRFTTAVGESFPDAAVSCGRFTALVEFKRPGEKLTLGQQQFIETWPGVVIVGRTPEQTLRDLERARAEVME